MDRTFRRKHATALTFGKRKRRPPIPRHSRKPPTSRQSVGDNKVTLPHPSTRYRNPADNAEVVRCRCGSESSTEGMLIDVITHQREAARSPNRDRAVQHDGETIDAAMTGVSADAINGVISRLCLASVVPFKGIFNQAFCPRKRQRCSRQQLASRSAQCRQLSGNSH